MSTGGVITKLALAAPPPLRDVIRECQIKLEIGDWRVILKQDW